MLVLGVPLDSHDNDRNDPINWRSLWTFSISLLSTWLMLWWSDVSGVVANIRFLCTTSLLDSWLLFCFPTRAHSLGNLDLYPTNLNSHRIGPSFRVPPIKGYEIKGQLTRCRQAPVVLSPSYKATSRFAPTKWSTWSTLSFVLSNRDQQGELPSQLRILNYHLLQKKCESEGFQTVWSSWYFIHKSLAWPEDGTDVIWPYEGWKPEGNGMHTSAADMDSVAYSCCMWVRNGTSTTTQIHLQSQVPSSNVFRRHFLRQSGRQHSSVLFCFIWISVTSGQTSAISHTTLHVKKNLMFTTNWYSWFKD